MAEDHGWMYSGRRNKDEITKEWIDKTTDFLDEAFSRDTGPRGVLCPCSRCANTRPQKRPKMIEHLVKHGFRLGYTLWVYHGESERSRSEVLRQCTDDGDHNATRMGEMVDDVHDAYVPTLEEEPEPTTRAFFDMLSAKERNGPDFDVIHSPIDVAAVYKAGAGKKHGRHMMANGFIDLRVSLSEARASVTGSSGDVRPQKRLRPSTDRISELETQVAQMKDLILLMQSQINGTTPRPPIPTLSTPRTAGSSAVVESNHVSADGHQARCSPVEDHVESDVERII